MSLTIAETRDIATCRLLRRVVFIDEQGVSEADERDDLDDIAIHLLAIENDQALGSARLIVQGETGKIGRVCVLQAARGRGIGAALIHAAVARLQKTPGVAKAKLGAQTHAIAFYQALGFTPVGEVYLDAGIDHQDMIRSL
ncbi:MAG: GNAT family N-acetyltransferase [Cypionkella sp.]|nr:GNAT family N-acetyltransferase [Cypionkella sp.]